MMATSISAGRWPASVAPSGAACTSRARATCRLGHCHQQSPHWLVHALPQGKEGEDFQVSPDVSDELKADLERFRRQERQQTSRSQVSPVQKEESSSPFASIKDTIDKVLIADFFLVLFALAWLGVGVVLANSSGTGSSPVLDAWYPLWPTLWQSAIGLLMAGALVSGGLGWLASKRQEPN